LLRVIYNAADVGLNTAITEGWGMVAFEHGATRAAQILPGHSVFAELWRDAAVLIPPALSLVTPDGLFEEYYVSHEDVASALDRLYEDAGYRERLATAAFARATQPSYSWDSIAQRWQALFVELLA
jgi:D-inositol-3-phosphate glycosyltransferase